MVAVLCRTLENNFPGGPSSMNLSRLFSASCSLQYVARRLFFNLINSL